MSQQRVEIWVDHLEDLTRVARDYSDFLRNANKEIPGNQSDLGFTIGPVTITIDGEPIGWSIDHWDDATWLVIEGKEDVE